MHKLASGAKLDLKVGGVVGGLGNEQRRIGYSPAGVQILDSTVLSKGTDRGVTSTGRFSTPMFVGHALSIGWDGGVSTSDGQRAEQGRPVEIFDARVNRLAAYAQDEWNITPRLEAKFPLKSLAANAPALDLRASISRNWSSADAVPAPDNRLNAQVPFLATIGADYKEGALTTGGSFAFKTGGRVHLDHPEQLPVGAARARSVRIVEVQPAKPAADGDVEPAGAGLRCADHVCRRFRHGQSHDVMQRTSRHARDDGDEVLAAMHASL